MRCCIFVESIRENSSVPGPTPEAGAMRGRFLGLNDRRFGWLALLAGVGLLGECARADGPIDYARQIKPILRQRCYACHGALKQKAGLRLDTGASIRRGGKGGPAVEPGHAEESPLIERVTDDTLGQRMPPEGSPLTAEQV